MRYQLSQFIVLLCALVLATGCNGAIKKENAKASEAELERRRVERIVSHCKSLTPYEDIEYRTYLEKLVHEKDFAALKAIYESDFTFSEWAAGEMAEAMPSSEVIAFCRQFPIGSANWLEAVLALQHHPKQHVIDYIKENVALPDGMAKHCCYRLCLIKGWDDLLDYAKADADNNTGISLPNLPADEASVGLMARTYIRAVEARRQ